MNDQEIEFFIKSDLTWHKSTKTFGSSDNFFNILWNNALEDKLNIFKSSNFRDFKKTKRFQKNGLRFWKIPKDSTTKNGLQFLKPQKNVQKTNMKNVLFYTKKTDKKQTWKMYFFKPQKRTKNEQKTNMKIVLFLHLENVQKRGQ